ncbi:MAG: metallophosphoesterase [Bryobacteraceae bacterium]|nr:metallophosphoesterase [Bryobacteraceae bacterium]
MRLLVFSDIHGDLAALERALAQEADYYIAAGDLVSWSRGLDRVGEMLRRRSPRVWVLPGNHESDQAIAEMCARHGLNAFHRQSFEAAGYHIAGLGYSNPTPFGTPGEYSEREIEKRLAAFAPLKPLILVCHCPPKDTPLDQASDGVHLGSSAVRAFIDRSQPAYFFCGHIHEAHGATATIGQTRAWNVGKKGVVLDFGKLDA